MHISHLFAGKPQPFGTNGAPSSIIKKPHQTLNIAFDGAVEDEQGNKKLHGGPFMALHQYSQSSYPILQRHFRANKTNIEIGSIGENISSPDMNEQNVYIGDQYQVGSSIIEVVSPRAPCSKINHRYGVSGMDAFIAQQHITGWYYAVKQEGKITLNDSIVLIKREQTPLSVATIWQLRLMIKTPPEKQDISDWLSLAEIAVDTLALAPEWQAYVNRAATKLSKL